MAKKEKEYKKLPGWGRREEGWISVSHTISRLWLGPDHLLSIDSEGGYRERYKRFYYRDIQALIVRKNSRGKGWNLLLSGMTLVFLLLGLAADGPGFQIFWFIMAGFFAVLFLFNWLRGPTCVGYVRTAVQTEQLPSLKRLRTADKVVARLTPLIEDAQGSLGRESIAEQFQEWSAREGEGRQTVAAPAPASMVQKRPLTIRPYNSRAHGFVFSVLLAAALVEGSRLFYQHLAVTIGELLLLAAFCGSVIWALIRQQDTDLPRAVQRVTWAALGYLIALSALGYVQHMIIAFSYPEIANDQFAILKLYTNMSPLDSGWLMAIFLFSCTSSLALGGFGWAWLLRYYAQRNASPPAPSDSQMPSNAP